QGEWWGPGYDIKEGSTVVDNGGVGYAICGEVNRARYHNGMSQLNILAEDSAAIRDERYKLVVNKTREYIPETDTIEWVTREELFEIDQAVPTPLLDTPTRNLLPARDPEIQLVYERLKGRMDDILASEPECRGDGNLDGVVDGRDLEEWSRIAHAWGLSSVYDFKIAGYFDGLTNTADAAVIQDNLGRPCTPPHSQY